MAYAGKLRALLQRGQRGRRGLTGSVAFGALFAFAPEVASAEAPAQPVSIVYDAPPACPTREALVSAVEARRPAQPERFDRRTFRVRIRSSSRGGYDGTLDVSTDGESAYTREVHTSSCVEAMTSMAVFITLALASPDEPREAPASEPPVTRAPPPVDTREAPSTPPAQPSAAPKPAPARATEPAKRAWTSGVAFVAAGLGKNAFGARVAGELAYLPARARPGGALRLSWGWADFSAAPERAGEARFRLQTTRAEPCLELPWRTLSWSACGAVEVGSLRATSADLPRTGRATMTWVAAGASTRLRWYILRRVSLEAGFAALAPFERRTFALAEPVRTIFRPAPVLFEGAFGLTVTATF